MSLDMDYPAEQTIQEAYIALGSNIGDRAGLLQQAIEMIHAHEGIQVLKVSHMYETDPVGYVDQPAFLNMVISVATCLSPILLLRSLLKLELQLGRIRKQRWGPRTIDLDLLLYDNVIMDQEELMLPHPRMMDRLFVLVPLHDVIADSHLLQEQVASLSQAALQSGKEGITLWKTINWHSESGHFAS